MTTYGYTSAGELAKVDYSDGTTPKVNYTYDRLGRRIGIEQASKSEIGNPKSRKACPTTPPANS